MPPLLVIDATKEQEKRMEDLNFVILSIRAYRELISMIKDRPTVVSAN